LIEDLPSDFANCQRASMGIDAAVAIVSRAPASADRDAVVNDLIEQNALAIALCKALGPDRDALVRTTSKALLRSQTDVGTINHIEAAELCTRGEFASAATLVEVEERPKILLGDCDYFAIERPWAIRSICGTGLGEEE
jgi:hypothetical protein